MDNDDFIQYYHRDHHDHLFNDQAAATVSCEDRPNIAAEYMGRAGRLYVRIKKYDDAVGDDYDEEDGDDDAEDEDEITSAEPAGFMFGLRNMMTR